MVMALRNSGAAALIRRPEGRKAQESRELYALIDGVCSKGMKAVRMNDLAQLSGDRKKVDRAQEEVRFALGEIQEAWRAHYNELKDVRIFGTTGYEYMARVSTIVSRALELPTGLIDSPQDY